MRLNTSCPNCDKSISTISYVKTKSEFVKKTGEEIEMFCEKCKTKSMVSTTSLHAVRSAAMNITIVLLVLVVIGLSFFMIKFTLAVESEYNVPYAALAMPVLGSIGLIWFMIADRKKINAFNEN